MAKNSKNPVEGVEFLTAKAFARRLFQGASGDELKRRVSWVEEQRKPSRSADPIPVLRLGKHPVYPWGSKAMNAWILRRMPS
jgi:hypothetical protein